MPLLSRSRSRTSPVSEQASSTRGSKSKRRSPSPDQSKSRSSKQKPSSKSKSDSQTPELVKRLAGAALAYSLKRLADKHQQKKEDSKQDDRSKSSKRKRRSSSRASNKSSATTASGGSSSSSSNRRRGSRAPLTTSESSDLHRTMVKLAVGAVGFGIKAYAKHRKEQAKKKHQRREQQQQYQPQSTTRDRGLGGALFGGRQQLGSGSGVISPELSAALESLVRELRQTEDAITGLTVDTGGRGKSSSHKKCEVRDRLVERAEGIKERIDDLQTTIHNIRNLDADLSRAQQTSGGDDTRAGDARVRERGRGFRRGPGRPEDSQGQEDEPRREKGRWGGGGSPGRPGRDRAEDERARPGRFGSDDRGDRPRSEMRLGCGGGDDGDGQRSRHHHPGPSIRSAWPERS